MTRQMTLIVKGSIYLFFWFLNFFWHSISFSVQKQLKKRHPRAKTALFRFSICFESFFDNWDFHIFYDFFIQVFKHFWHIFKVLWNVIYILKDVSFYNRIFENCPASPSHYKQLIFYTNCLSWPVTSFPDNDVYLWPIELLKFHLSYYIENYLPFCDYAIILYCSNLDL